MHDVAFVSHSTVGEAGAQPLVYALAGSITLAVCPVADAAPSRLVATADGKLAAGASASLILPLRPLRGGPGACALVAFQFPDPAPQSLALRSADEAHNEIALPATRLPFDAAALFAGLDPASRVRAVRFLFDLPHTAFPRLDGRAFAGLARDLLRAIGAAPATLAPLAAPHDALVLWSGSLPAAVDGPVSAAIVAPERNARLSPPLVGAPGRRGRSLHLVTEAFARGALAVFFGHTGIAAARLPARDAAPQPLLAWLERDSKVPGRVREYVASCLAARAPREPAAATALAELGLFKPLARRRIVLPKQPVGAAIELAAGCGSGLFVSGWVRDPHEVVEALTLDESGGNRAIDLTLRFARPEIEQGYAKSEHRLADPRIGFAAFLPGPTALTGQHGFALRLRSGATLPLVAAPAPNDPAAARNAVLAAVPATSATAEAVIRCIGPAAAALHRLHLARRRAPELVVFGNPPRRPRASIVVPLYRNLDFLRFQLAAFAVDKALRDVELIYVLDSPEQREAVEHMLEGFHGLYGMPLKLVIMSSNFGYAAANNAGVAHAEGRLLLLLNSDVVPAAPGWFEAMGAAFETPAGRKVGAVGPKLLFDDGSLQHAGLFFRRDRRGRWFNDHYFKGMPRDFPAACRAGRVPAVTGAAVMVPGALFRAVGGFTEDYIIGDYEDSDLCLKLRRAGRDILYVPAAELHHFERKSIERHAGYMRGVASEYNGWLHHQRWDATIATLMEEFTPAIRAERRRVSA